MLVWIENQPDYNRETDLIVIAGDFNATPESQTYAIFAQFGYTSCHKHIHGKEPEKTFPTGLKAEFMDTDPALTCDFIFVRGVKYEIAASQVDTGSTLCKPSD